MKFKQGTMWGQIPRAKDLVSSSKETVTINLLNIYRLNWFLVAYNYSHRSKNDLTLIGKDSIFSGWWLRPTTSQGVENKTLSVQHSLDYIYHVLPSQDLDIIVEIGVEREWESKVINDHKARVSYGDSKTVVHKS